jgi:uncharacterized Zn finger protein (UPF0148 family)
MAEPVAERASALRRASYTGPACPRCAAALDVARLSAGEQACPSCGRPFTATPFSPPAPRVAVESLAAAGPAGAAACAQHAGNAAVATCTRCGLFLCPLCAIEIDGRVLCPACFERLSAEGALPSMRTRLGNYRGCALLAGIGGCLISWLGLLTGPLTLYLAVRARRQQQRLQEFEGTPGIVAAVVLGLLQIAGSLFLLGAVLFQFWLAAKGRR